MTNLKNWHVIQDNLTGKRTCCYYDPDMPMLDFDEPNSLDGKEVPFEEWNANEISQILSSFLDYSGFGEVAFLPETLLWALDCKVDESKKVEIMREILNGVISKDLD